MSVSIIRNPLRAILLAVVTLCMTPPTSNAYWAIDVSSQFSGTSSTPTTSGSTPSGGGFYSWYFYGSFYGSAAFTGNGVHVTTDCEAYSSTAFYRASVTNLYAYSYANAYAYAYWRWYGMPGASTAVSGNMRIDIQGEATADGSVSASPGGSASTTAYGQASCNNQVWYGSGSAYANGWAKAQGWAAANSTGTASLTGNGASWTGNGTSVGTGYFWAYGWYSVWLNGWHYTPAGLPFVYAHASGGVSTRSTSNSYSPPGGNLNMGSSDAWATASGVSEVYLWY